MAETPQRTDRRSRPAAPSKALRVAPRLRVSMSKELTVKEQQRWIRAYAKKHGLRMVTTGKCEWSRGCPHPAEFTYGGRRYCTRHNL